MVVEKRSVCNKSFWRGSIFHSCNQCRAGTIDELRLFLSSSDSQWPPWWWWCWDGDVECNDCLGDEDEEGKNDENGYISVQLILCNTVMLDFGGKNWMCWPFQTCVLNGISMFFDDVIWNSTHGLLFHDEVFWPDENPFIEVHSRSALNLKLPIFVNNERQNCCYHNVNWSLANRNQFGDNS